MKILKAIFAPIVAVFKFINTYFKAMIFLLIVALLAFSFSSQDTNTPNLTQINIKGAIFSAENILRELKSAEDNDNIKGVFLLVDSPGGALAPSVELKMAVERLSAKKPVVAYASGSMTSGSYYLSINANKILANPGSFIGSIGVIMQSADISELARKIGIAPQIAKAGEFKEAGTFLRAWNDKEREQINSLVKQSYNMFVSDVAKARSLDINASDNWANARVFLAKDAVKMGLIDEVSDYYSARKELEKLSGVSEPKWKQKSTYEKLMDRAISSGANSLSSLFFGLWAR